MRLDDGLSSGRVSSLHLTLSPIGFARTPFRERLSAPRQPHLAKDVEGAIELVPGLGLEHAVSDLETWEYIWVVFWFHLNTTWRPKVLPPRSKGRRRGVLATRSPHRPNPIGLSVVRLCGVEGLTLRVRGLDLLDGSPVLDIKPYVAAADSIATAGTGWLEGPGATTDSEAAFAVEWSALAREQVDWLRDAQGIELDGPVHRILTLGPQPHPYRRIKALGAHAMQLAYKEWRIRFRCEDRTIRILDLASGYRERELVMGQSPELVPHQQYVARFGRPSPL